MQYHSRVRASVASRPFPPLKPHSLSLSLVFTCHLTPHLQLSQPLNLFSLNLTWGDRAVDGDRDITSRVGLKAIERESVEGPPGGYVDKEREG